MGQHHTVHIENLSFIYDSSDTPLFNGLSLALPPGWTGVVGGNGTGKTTLLRLVCGVLEPQKGHIGFPGEAVYCPQETDNPPENLERMLNSGEGVAGRLRSSLKLNMDWAERWETLSHGERKRAQIAVALWREPHVLAVDEPSNHLDEEARQLLYHAMRTFRGTGLVVSHDRFILNRLCRRCLFVTPPIAVLRKGPYSSGRKQVAMEEAARDRERKKVKGTIARLSGEASRRRGRAGHADRRTSKKGLARGDADGRARKDQARLTGKDASDGRAMRRLAGRIRQESEKLEKIPFRKQYRTGIRIEGQHSHRDFLFSIPAGTFSLYPGSTLAFPDLVMGPQDRIGITGGNGTGKSTLLGHLLTATDLPEERICSLPQEIGRSAAQQLVRELRRLPGEELGDTMAIVSRLGSRPGRLMESEHPSPGEIRKLMIARGIQRGVHLMVMDEPTNHLDLPSIECLEAALADCPCALVIVSHDHTFLKKLTTVEWHLATDDFGSGTCHLSIL